MLVLSFEGVHVILMSSTLPPQNCRGCVELLVQHVQHSPTAASSTVDTANYQGRPPPPSYHFPPPSSSSHHDREPPPYSSGGGAKPSRSFTSSGNYGNNPEYAPSLHHQYHQGSGGGGVFAASSGVVGGVVDLDLAAPTRGEEPEEMDDLGTEQ